MREEVEEEKINELVERGIIESFLHREKESFVSLTVKYIVNFIFSCIQFLNIPGFICVAIVSFNPILGLFSVETKLPNEIIYISLIGYGLFVVVRHLHQSTITNMTSRNIDLIWFVNSKKDLRNWFYSIPMAERHYSNLNDYLSKENEIYLNEKLEFSNKKINELKKELSRINELENFPNSTFRSLELVNSRIAEYCNLNRWAKTDDVKLNHNLHAILNTILLEICHLDVFKDKVVSANILFDCRPHMSDFNVFGDFRLLESDKEPLSGNDSFINHVITKNEVVFVSDITNKEDSSWFSQWKNKSEYNAIIAYPMKFETVSISSTKNHIVHYAKNAVIVLHFAKGIEYNKLEKAAIARTISTYSKAINLAVQIYFNYSDEYQIKKAEKK